MIRPDCPTIAAFPLMSLEANSRHTPPTRTWIWSKPQDNLIPARAARATEMSCSTLPPLAPSEDSSPLRVRRWP